MKHSSSIRFLITVPLAISWIILSCCSGSPPPPTLDFMEVVAPINMIAVTGHPEILVFHEVTRANDLPIEVREFLGGIANPGEPFNIQDFNPDPRLPWHMLFVAAVSEKYSIVTYASGGLGPSTKTEIFEVSNGKAKPIWKTTCMLGGTFRALKEAVESGRFRNNLGGFALGCPE